MATTTRNLVIATLLCTLVLANRELTAQGVINLKPFSVTGKIVSVEPGKIVIRSASGATAAVAVSKPGEKTISLGKVARVNTATSTTVTGQLPPDSLQQGAYIKFSALVDKRGSAQGEISKITRFLPEQGYQPGMFPDGNAEAEGKKPADAKKPSAGGKPYLVSGMIAAIRKGVVSVRVPRSPAAPRGMVKAKLAKDAVVVIDGSDYLMGRPGDDISVRGGQYKNIFVGQQVKITLLSRAANQPGKKKGPRIAKGPKGKGKKKDPFDLGDQKGADPKKDGKKEAKDGKKSPDTEPDEEDPFLKGTDDDDERKGDEKKADDTPAGKSTRKKNTDPKVLTIK